ncbi:flagellar biosynthesis protein FlhF [Paenibacillus humicus]|uniref:flagellar biosynthesis protein FlhF n=1 Tax=Paenibacillus humicus TaxID=412861 RepID=UPI000FDAAC34|nr:flagellar biosynthesis protein FlhF [Paenibacillus humicus]
MRVKRYVVSSMPEAMALIRGDLGKDAVILSTKEIKTGGFLGMFGKKGIEVVAAAETVSPPAPSPAFADTLQSLAAAASRQSASPEPEAAPRQPAALSSTAAPSAPASLAAAKYKSVAKPAASPPAFAGEAAPEPAVSAGEAAASNGSAAAAPASGFREPASQGMEPDLLREVRDLKTWIRQLSGAQAAETAPVHVSSLMERLEAQEVKAAWRERLLADLQAKPDYSLLSEDPQALWAAAAEHLQMWLEPYMGEKPAEHSRVLHFVGPTGVGKTTTIAKLAADLTLRHRKAVGLITADTYRIAAVDQLRTYADILGIPLEVVFSPAEAARAFQQLEQKDAVLMDTAGRNYRSELQIHEVNSLLRSSEDADTLLVLSLTARTPDMEAVAQPFIRHGVDKVIFTKLDETTVYGAAFNLIMDHGLKPAYLAFGQTVPDDLEPFRSDRYVKLLLGNQPNE